MKQVIVIGLLVVIVVADASPPPRVSAAPIKTMTSMASRRFICAWRSSTGLNNLFTPRSAQNLLRLCRQMYILHFLDFADHDCARSLPLEYGTAGANILANVAFDWCDEGSP